MKKNAVIIAGIMFVAGCASNGGYSTAQNDAGLSSPTSDVAMSRSTELVARTPQGELIPPSDPSLSTQYDPAMGGFNATVSGSSSSDLSPRRNMDLSVNDYHADSSVRGSDEARGWARENLPTESAPHPLNPAVQAESSLRGGSPMARESDWYAPGAPITSAPQHSRIKADSSIRGGSNAARYGSSFQSSSDRQLNPDASTIDQGTRFEYLGSDNLTADNDLGGRKPSNWPSEKDAIMGGAANNNAADDLLKDGTRGRPELLITQPATDASVSGAATSKTGSTANTAPLDDLDVAPHLSLENGPVAIDDSLSSAGSRKDLNSSWNLERDIQGSYDQSPITSDMSASQNSGSSTAVGGPGSTETGAASSSDKGSANESVQASPDTGSGQGSYSLFQQNRAQGLGSAAAGGSGAAQSDILVTGSKDSDQLAESVKRTLMRETTGTSGITEREVARNVQVESHDGVVTLKGTVPNQKAKDVLDIRVREIDGVRRVKDELKVQSAPDKPLQDLNAGRNLEDITDQLHDLGK